MDLIALSHKAIAGDAAALDEFHKQKWSGEVFDCRFCGREITWPGMCESCEKREDESKETTEGKLIQLGVPSTMADCAWGNYEAPKVGTVEARQVEAVKRWRGITPGLVLTGPPGTGKTHIAVSIIRQRIEEKGPEGVLWLADMEIGSRLKSGFNDRERKTVDEAMKVARLLVIDDFGQSYQTPWMTETVVPVLCHRLDNGMPTILTTNMVGDDFKTLDARLESRLQQAERLTTRNLVDSRGKMEGKHVTQNHS